jgi:ubiquinone/menaquinone biosynthesis C-methylase UbiE
VGTFACLSDERRYAHDEAKYDEQYLNEADREDVGRGAATIARVLGGDFSASALEIGCGTGLLSVGLVAARGYPSVLITDPSVPFLEITQKKVTRAGYGSPQVHFAVLLAEDLSRVPDSSLSLVVLRSALHHVLEWERFIAESARVLKPGGVLEFQEPCAEGYVLMGALAQLFPLVVEHHEPGALTSRHKEQVQLFVDTMRFGARRDVDKSAAEDKHEFRIDEVVKAGRTVGIEFEFLRNVVFEDCVKEIPPARRPTSFFVFFRDYLKYCMSFDAELIRLFERHFERYCEMPEALSRTGDGPSMHGVFAGRKIAR